MAKEATSSNTHLKSVYLHKAIMIDGRTEATLTKVKVPTLTSLHWTQDYTALVVTGKDTHILPAAAVADSIVGEL